MKSRAPVVRSSTITGFSSASSADRTVLIDTKIIIRNRTRGLLKYFDIFSSSGEVLYSWKYTEQSSLDFVIYLLANKCSYSSAHASHFSMDLTMDLVRVWFGSARNILLENRMRITLK